MRTVPHLHLRGSAWRFLPASCLVTCRCTRRRQGRRGRRPQLRDQDRRTVACWGSNSNGQATPLRGTFSAVDAGGLHTCAIRTDATVACWGKNDDGGSTPASGTFSLGERRRRSQLRSQTDGTLACWGRDTQSPPFNVAPPGTYRRRRRQHSRHHVELRRATGGTITCWGYNSSVAGTPRGTAPTRRRRDPRVRAHSRRGPRVLGRLHLQRRPPCPTPPAGIFRPQRGLRPHMRDPGRRPWRASGRHRRRSTTPPAGTFGSLSAGYSHGCAVSTNGAVRVLGLERQGQVTGPGRAHAAAGEGSGGLDFPAQAASTVSAPQESPSQTRRRRPRDRG